MDSKTTTAAAGENYYHVITECPYQDTCTSKGAKCASCGNNPKKDYWIPIIPTYIPYIHPKLPDVCCYYSF